MRDCAQWFAVILSHMGCVGLFGHVAGIELPVQSLFVIEHSSRDTSQWRVIGQAAPDICFTPCVSHAV